MSTAVKREKLAIGGSWEDGSSDTVYTVKNVYNGNPIAEIKLANTSDLDRAYNEAKAAQPAWFAASPYFRVQVMEKAAQIIDNRREELVRYIMEEGSGSHRKAQHEVNQTISIMKECATYPLRMTGEILPSVIPGKENRVYRTPIGVVGVISPWNTPLFLSMRSVAAALATGNSVVLKPDLQTPISGGLAIAQVFEEAGLPKGVLNVVVADLAEIGDAFIEHPIPKMISFTGSTAAGKHIGGIAGRHLKKVSLELGGNSAFIVLDDANLDQAVSAAMFGKFHHQGQVCMGINRIIVDRKVVHAFADKLKTRVAALKVGDPSDPETVICPLINRNQAAKIEKLVQSALDEGAKLILPGKIEGNLVEPHIFTDVTNDMAIARAEIFGPVAIIIPANGEEEAVRIANDTEYGLSGAVFTESLERGVRVAKQIHSGMAHVNDSTINVDPLAAFGGEKDSGLGRHGGHWSIEEFTTVKWISVQETPRVYPFS